MWSSSRLKLLLPVNSVTKGAVLHMDPGPQRARRRRPGQQVLIGEDVVSLEFVNGYYPEMPTSLDLPSHAGGETGLTLQTPSTMLHALPRAVEHLTRHASPD